MKCPNCSTALVMADRQGIEIDYCPDCRGVWLDRGELDKIIERTAGATDASSRASSGTSDRRRDDDDDSDRYKRPIAYQPYKKKKMSSMLGDIFDF